jgi:hypothetical protein
MRGLYIAIAAVSLGAVFPWTFAPAAAAVEATCTLPEAPSITIDPRTDDIKYDFTQDSAALKAMKSDTVSPYAPGADTATGGLREDHPEIKAEMTWGVAEYPDGHSCMWHKSINVTIRMHPKIYIARDRLFDSRECRAAILEHEKKHVAADHRIMNDFSRRLGVALQQLVNNAGPPGPYPTIQLDQVQAMLEGKIGDVMSRQQDILAAETRRIQGGIDSLQEYRRVSAICDQHPGR